MPNRLFLAVQPPPTVVAALEAFVGPRRDADAGLRWVHPEHWHVTLVFLGAVADAQTDLLVPSLDVVAARTPGFELAVQGAGSFPHPDAARVLWLGVVEGVGELGQLALRCRTAAARCGIKVEGGEYAPHLTLARGRRGVRARRWLQVIDTFPALAWRVGEAQLVESELTRGGPRYRTRNRFVLAGE